MPKHIFTFLLVIFTTICFGQTRGVKELQECELLLKDGTSFEGFCKITKNDRIQFSMERDSTPDVWDEKHVKSVTFFRSQNDQVLEYHKTRIGKRPKLLEIIVYGDIMLYDYSKFRFMSDKNPIEVSTFPVNPSFPLPTKIYI